MALVFFLSKVDSFVWIFPAFRQFRTPYRTYFLLLATAGSYILVPSSVMHHSSYANYIHLSISSLILFSLLPWRNIVTKIIAPLIALVVFFIWAYLQHPYRMVELFIFTCIHTMILVLFLRRLFIEAFDTLHINLAQLLLIIYEMSLIIRFFMSLTNSIPGYFYFIISDLIEISVAIFFIFVRSDNKRLRYRIQTDEALASPMSLSNISEE
jgi:hypothetical protein